MKKVIPIPPGVHSVTIHFDDEPEQIGVEEAFEKAEKVGSATVAMHEAEHAHKATGLDILRMRGTPIDMVHSAVIAEDIELAGAMFRTSILEYVYEKIQAIWPTDTVRFIHSKNLHRNPHQENQLGLEVEGSGRGIAFTPEFDAVPFEQHGFVPLCTIDGGRIHLVISDDADAAVMRIIEDLTERIVDVIRDGVANAGIKKETPVTFNLVVDLSTISIKIDKTGIDAEASIPVIAYVGHVD